MVELKEIKKDNLDAVLGLRVSESQKAYVSSTACSLAQAYVYRENAFPFAIYADNTLVGFIMFGYYEAKKQYTIWKFLIDERHQNKGYGRAALRQGVTFLKNKFGVREIYLGVTVGNESAKHLYTSMGFRKTGLIENNMEEMRLSVEKSLNQYV